MMIGKRPVHRKALLAVGFVAAATLLCVLWVLNRPLSAREVAEKFRDCWLAANAQCVAEYMDDAELKANSMTVADLQSFLSQWLRPRLSGTLAGEQPDIAGQPARGFQEFTWYVDTNSGRIPVAVFVAKTEKGLKVLHPLTSAVLTLASRDEEGKQGAGKEKLANLIKNVSLFKPQLEQFNLRVLAFGVHDYRPIPQMIAHWQSVLEKLEALDLQRQRAGR
jgi:hypothetical protein